MLATRLHNLSRQALSDFYCLRNTAALGDQPRHIRTRPEIAAVLQPLDTNPDGDFLYFCDVFLALHCASYLPCSHRTIGLCSICDARLSV